MNNMIKRNLKIKQVDRNESNNGRLLVCSHDSQNIDLGTYVSFKQCINISVNEKVNIAFFDNQKFEVLLYTDNGTFCMDAWIKVRYEGERLIELLEALPQDFSDKIGVDIKFATDTQNLEAMEKRLKEQGIELYKK